MNNMSLELCLIFYVYILLIFAHFIYLIINKDEFQNEIAYLPLIKVPCSVYAISIAIALLGFISLVALAFYLLST